MQHIIANFNTFLSMLAKGLRTFLSFLPKRDTLKAIVWSLFLGLIETLATLRTMRAITLMLLTKTPCYLGKYMEQSQITLMLLTKTPCYLGKYMEQSQITLVLLTKTPCFLDKYMEQFAITLMLLSKNL